MNLNIFDTHRLLMAIEEIARPSTFLRDRYFPHNSEADLFATNDVLVEYKDGNKTIAPFVVPRKGGLFIARESYTMDTYKPPCIAPSRMLTIDELEVRGFGEALLTNLTPEQRELAMLLADVAELDDMITRREEAMASEVLLTNGCVMHHHADKVEDSEVKKLQFYNEEANPAVYTPAVKWNAAGAKILDDLAVMMRTLTSRGLPATDLIVPTDTAQTFLADETIQRLLDLRNYNIGEVDPTLIAVNAALIAKLNVMGRPLNVIVYDETYTADDGTETPYIPSGYAILTAPGCGRAIYGAVTQLEQADGRFHTYKGRRVPKYLSDPIDNVRSVTLTSCPILMPRHKSPWIAAKVLS